MMLLIVLIEVRKVYWYRVANANAYNKNSAENSNSRVKIINTAMI